MESLKRPLILLALSLLAAALFAAGCASKNEEPYEPSSEQRVVDKAFAALQKLGSQDDLENLMSLIAGAKGVAILPETTKGAFLYGAQLGVGVILGRDYATGRWSYPAFCTTGDMSVGVQAGFQTGPLVLVLLSDKALVLGVDAGFSLGGDASVTIGPVTAANITSTDTAAKDVAYYWAPVGLYAGVSLKGGVLLTQQEMNAAYYLDPDATAHRVVIENKYTNPGAQPLVDYLNTLSTATAASRDE
ncbi:MAG: lipid-binding SYLF domain-containing protein [Desulfovibrionaceae bacterium]|jgi:lipid-binding SYLF domain-containing protein